MLWHAKSYNALGLGRKSAGAKRFKQNLIFELLKFMAIWNRQNYCCGRKPVHVKVEICGSHPKIWWTPGEDSCQDPPA